MASESEVIGWVWADILLLVETAEVWEVRESTLRRPGLWPRTDPGGLPSEGSLPSEILLEVDGEGERVGDRSRETLWGFDLASLSRSRRKKPVKRLSLRESATEFVSSCLGLGDGEWESFGGWSAPGTER